MQSTCVLLKRRSTLLVLVFIFYNIFTREAESSLSQDTSSSPSRGSRRQKRASQETWSLQCLLDDPLGLLSFGCLENLPKEASRVHSKPSLQSTQPMMWRKSGSAWSIALFEPLRLRLWLAGEHLLPRFLLAEPARPSLNELRKAIPPINPKPAGGTRRDS